VRTVEPCRFEPELKAFLRGELGRSEVRAIVRHLLAGCPRCAEAARRAWGLGGRPLAFRILQEERDRARAARAASGL
jgi:hypothetical protein